jgi:hypothetical protein
MDMTAAPAARGDETIEGAVPVLSVTIEPFFLALLAPWRFKVLP